MKMSKIMLFGITATLIFLGCAGLSKEPQKKLEVQLFQCGWPAFSFSYPRDWKIALLPIEGQVYRVAAKGGFPNAAASVNANMPAPVKFFSRSVLPALSEHGSDFDIVQDQAVTLNNSADAWETQLNWVLKSGMAVTTHFVTVKKNDMWITVSVSSEKGQMSDDLKSIAYSLDVDPRIQQRVGLPDDVTQFFNEVTNAIVAHDLDKVLSYYSDQYLRSGRDKVAVKKFWQRILDRIPEFKYVLTQFEKRNDLADISGYVEVMGNKYPLAWEVLRQRKDGRWEYYGDQKN